METLLTSRPSVGSARAIARSIREGRATAEAVVSKSLERAAASEAVLQAWHAFEPELALEQARRLDRQPAKGLLHGVPIAIKDLSDTSDLPTAYGSPVYRDHRPAMDAACVAALRAAGAVVLGKTATVEFGASRPCATTNPHNPLHTPGGSSAGSAAVVADGQVSLSTGTQTGGSIIRPAAFCGVVGFKPTFGSIAVAGTKSYAWSLDTVGGFANSVADVSLLFEAMSGHERSRFDESDCRPPRIGIFLGPFADVAAPSTVDALMRVAAACSRAGATVREIDAPAIFRHTLEWQRAISRYEMGRSLLPETRAFSPEELGEVLLAEIRAGQAVPETSYIAAKAGASRLATELQSLFADTDLLLALSTPGEAPFGLASTGDATFCLGWSLLGLPTLNLPAGTGPQNLPLGVQLVGPRYGDECLLRFAAWVERVVSDA
ncbi:amidase [Bosea lathyri]|uniref:Asp-tRNAAsn/Glu-tRNAGln amidotransferase A subunit n=1 Tax=Bosea lathyri TaxID=1036778 RepID=A0A1H6D9B6_9HYPH|nr:amidase [Bosea lathyri]SEG81768.1 Asp-tRNAAsn/Glu-tRNAGln amidotransferase A subunit [Bosea lathyri]